MITAAKIHELPGDVIHYIQGPLNAKVLKILPPEQANPEALVFASKQEQLDQALKQNASIVIAHKSLKIPEKSHACFFTTPHVQLAMATVGSLFDKKIQRFQQEEHIHPRSCVHPSAQLGKNVIVGPCAVIGAEAHIGDNCIIGATTVVESHAKIGRNTILHPQVFIGAYCEVGAFCEIQPHATIGADGFGYVALKGSHPVKIPQLGIVVLEDHVEIGANTTIDRAALTDTRIGAGSKIDNISHIGHNCQIGKNTLAAASFKMAGSTTIGDNFMGGGDIVITDHLHIADNVVLAGRSAVTKDITEAGQYGGYPLQPLKDSLKTLASSVQIVSMRKQLSRIMKHLNISEE